MEPRASEAGGDHPRAGPGSQAVHLICQRMAHHARASGYDRLLDFIGGNIIESPEHLSYWERAMVKVLRPLIRNSGSRWYQRASLLNEVRAARLWVAARGQIFHFLYGENHYRYLGNLKRLRKNNFIVCTYHTPPERFREVVTDRRHLSHVDAAIVVSNAQREFFGELVGPQRVFYIPHGIDTDYFRPATSRPEAGDRPLRALFVGSHLRDLTTLARAARLMLMSERKIVIHVVTKPEYHPQFSELPNVMLYSGIPDADLLRLYREADFYLFPLLDCTANNGLLEALASGLPIVTTDLPGVRDYVCDECALLVPLGDAQALAEAARTLSADRDRLRRMGEACRRRSQDFRWERVGEQVMDVYDHVIRTGA